MKAVLINFAIIFQPYILALIQTSFVVTGCHHFTSERSIEVQSKTKQSFRLTTVAPASYKNSFKIHRMWMMLIALYFVCSIGTHLKHLSFLVQPQLGNNGTISKQIVASRLSLTDKIKQLE